MNTRAIAASVITQVIQNHRSLNGELTAAFNKIPSAKDKSFIQELCYGSLRWYFRLDKILSPLLKKPLKVKDQDIYCLLIIGLYQLLYLKTPSYAAVSETVSATRALKKPWASGLVNKILKVFMQQQTALCQQAEQSLEGLYCHPNWFIEALQIAWPSHWQQILQANNERPPLSLRVNLSKISRADYLELLHKANMPATTLNSLPSAIILNEPVAIKKLPGFGEGLCSVQDAAAQLAASILQLNPQQRVLDACAAPGGKTSHILECEPKLKTLMALDKDAKRLQKVKENLDRLGLQATLLCANAALPDDWWDKAPYDRILLDAPCSATGVIRRHPDIKLLRQQEDIARGAKQQLHLLQQLWPLLKPGGILVYATCSILPQENSDLIKSFLQTTANATHVTIAADWGHALDYGRQIFPGENNMDGFYYACLQSNGQKG